ncbi:hypothetical protein FQZ97_1071650 [compost metagenome]
MRQTTEGWSGRASSGAIQAAWPASTSASRWVPPFLAVYSATRMGPTHLPTRCCGGRFVARTAMSASRRVRLASSLPVCSS